MKKKFVCALFALVFLLAVLPLSALAEADVQPLSPFTSASPLKDFKVTNGKRVSVDLDGDGKKDSISYKDNENADGYIKITFSKTKKTWKYTLKADDFYRNPGRTLYNKLRTVVFKSASGDRVFAFMTPAVGNGGDADAFGLLVFVLKNGKMTLQKLTPPTCTAKFSADGTTFTFKGEDTGSNQKLYVNPEFGKMYAGLSAWTDFYTDFQCVTSNSGGCSLMLGMKMYGENRVDALGTFYTVFKADGKGKLKAAAQAFAPDFSAGTDPGIFVDAPSASATAELLDGLIASNTVGLIGMTFEQISKQFAPPVSYTLMTDWQPYFAYSGASLAVEQVYFNDNYYPADAYEKDSMTYKASEIVPRFNKKAVCTGVGSQVSMAMEKLIGKFVPDTSITGKLVDDEEFGFCYRFTYKGYQWLITSPTGGYIASISDVLVTKAN